MEKKEKRVIKVIRATKVIKETEVMLSLTLILLRLN
jgi:hypothetical protein